MSQAPSIERTLPHRYPFLLVDRVTEFVPGERIAGVKTITANESPLQGHFPGAPLLPPGLLLEIVTQLGAVLVLERPEMAGKVAMILQIPSARIARPIRVGEVVEAEARILKLKEHLGELEGVAKVAGELVAEGRMRFAIAPPSLALRATSLLP